MRNLLAGLFGICMLSTTVSMIGQFVHKDAKEVKSLQGAVKFGGAVRDVAKFFKAIGDNKRREFLAKIDKQELIHDLKYYLTSLKPELVQEVRGALKLLDISDSLIEEIPILGVKHIDNDYRVRSLAQTVIDCIPPILTPHNKARSFIVKAILINTEALLQKPSFYKKFVFLHEGGHIKECCSGVNPGEEPVNEVTADTLALAVLTRLTKKNDFKNLTKNLHLVRLQKPRLSSEELVYHGEKIFNIQQKGSKLNVLTYARKIVADREKDGYEERITAGAKRLLGSICNDVLNVLA